MEKKKAVYCGVLYGVGFKRKKEMQNLPPQPPHWPFTLAAGKAPTPQRQVQEQLSPPDPAPDPCAVAAATAALLVAELEEDIEDQLDDDDDEDEAVDIVAAQVEVVVVGAALAVDVIWAMDVVIVVIYLPEVDGLDEEDMP